MRSHANFYVFDSTKEASEAFVLEPPPEVAAWMKNDHHGFEVFCVHPGVVRRYRPDFLIRLASSDILILETKGQDSDQDRTKRRSLAEWVEAVNAHGGFGRWSWDVSKATADIWDTLRRGPHGWYVQRGDGSGGAGLWKGRKRCSATDGARRAEAGRRRSGSGWRAIRARLES